MNVLIAYDKFKDSLTAEEACDITARILRGSHPGWTVETAPLTDGGDGFCRILTTSRGGSLRSVTVLGPRFRETEALLGMVDLAALDPSLRQWLDVPAEGKIAIIEMAQASGLQMLAQNERDLWHTSSFGTGQLIDVALREGAAAILLGVGGSATSDLGLGALEALGLACQDRDGDTLSRVTPSVFDRIEKLSRTLPQNLPPIRIACDVQNPLLGPNGAAAVYGPQKGLQPEDLDRLDTLGEKMAHLICEKFGADKVEFHSPGGGAAGGIAFGLKVACGARLVPGFELVSQWLQVEEKVDRADIVITGEGRFDRSSLQGKGPGTLIESAGAKGKQAWVFAGSVTTDLQEHLPRHLPVDRVCGISPAGYPLERAFAEAGDLLAAAVSEKLGQD